MSRRNKQLLTIILTMVCYFEVAIISSSGLYNEGIDKNLESLRFKRRITNELSALPQMEVVDRNVEYFIRKWGIQGASVAVMKDGKLVYAKGYGHTDADTREEVQPEHLFRVASVSKLITAVAIMKLAENNQLSLEDTVFGEQGILNDSIYLNIRDRKVTQITVRHLLEHSAGWSTRGGDPLFNVQSIANRLGTDLPLSIPEVISHELRYKRLYFYPGSRSYYSNFGYVVLGEVIRKISGQPYEQYVQNSILKPLGIDHMHIGRNLKDGAYPEEVTYYDKPQAPYRLSCYGNGKMVPRTYGGTDVQLLSAAGGWVASSVDLMKLLAGIDNQPVPSDILNSESIHTMTHPAKTHLSPLGWRKVNSEGSWWRTGTLAGTSAVLVKRHDDISFVMITNTSTWKGSRFSSDMRYMLNHAINQVEEWPDQNLFEYRFPNHISPIPPEWWMARHSAPSLQRHK